MLWCTYLSLSQCLVCLCFLKEEQISELLRNSGDSSEQLTMLSQQLREKDRCVSMGVIYCTTWVRGGVGGE